MDISATPSPSCRHSVSLEAKSQPASAEFISTKFPKYCKLSTKLGLECLFFFFFLHAYCVLGMELEVLTTSSHNNLVRQKGLLQPKSWLSLLTEVE